MWSRSSDDCAMMSLTVSLDSLAQPVPLGTGAPIVSIRVTVTTEPSAVPTTGSAGAALAGLDFTALSVSLSRSTLQTHSAIYCL